MPPIVADDTFQAAQQVSRDNTQWSPRRAEPGQWLLRGLVTCGTCQVGVNCHKMRGRNATFHRYYYCRNHDPLRAGGEHRRCPERNIRADALDTFVADQVRQALRRPEVLLAGEHAVAERAPAPDDELLDAQLTRLDRKTEATQVERRRLVDCYQAGLLDLVVLRVNYADVIHCGLVGLQGRPQVSRVPPLEITPPQRTELERRLRAHTTTQRALRRARIILLAADGVANRQIARQVGIDEKGVATWRRRFAAEGLAGLADRGRPGRPRVYGHDARLAIVATVTTQQPQVDSHWSARLVAERLAEEHDIRISGSQVGRVLADLDLKPHLVRGWLNRPDDPAFFARAADVCGLYLDRPHNALVLSVDEKTAIGARSRKYPTKPVAAGQLERREFEYTRHGTACLVAALDVHSGQVLGSDVTKNDSAHFIGFLEEIDRSVHPDLAIHLVLDNGSSHVSKQTTAWLAAHPRFQAHYTPKHASWLNQVELFFSILAPMAVGRKGTGHGLARSAPPGGGLAPAGLPVPAPCEYLPRPACRAHPVPGVAHRTGRGRPRRLGHR